MTLNYDPEKLDRELKRHYICSTEQEIQEMLQTINKNSLENLFDHIDSTVKFDKTINPTKEYEYYELKENMEEISAKNKIKPHFIGDGLKHYSLPSVLPEICNIRGLTTAYTPYQPERSQGTLTTLWNYASALSELTGFEAINASLYERSTCLFEAIKTGLKSNKKQGRVLITNDLYPGDKEVLMTLAKHTNIEIDFIDINFETGLVETNELENKIKETDYSVLAFPQVNALGIITYFNEYTDIARDHNIKSIAIIDPIHLSTRGLKKPAHFGSENLGCDIIVGEGQHLCLAPNFGGPGLGIFGVRYNEQDKLTIRHTPGRYIGDAKDLKGRTCKAIILSTREQHIRKDKATSNICSNQSFIASLAGASMLIMGDEGIAARYQTSTKFAQDMASQMASYSEIELPFKKEFVNEFVIKVNKSQEEMRQLQYDFGLEIGVEISDRIENKNSKVSYYLMYFNDQNIEEKTKVLTNFMDQNFTKSQSENKFKISDKNTNKEKTNLPSYDENKILTYYQELGNQNVSPDDAIYPLGSCTMKYNPYINDYAAGLRGFTDIHPQTNLENAQGSLEVLYEIQEQFKIITGLPGVTTQPVAGAQGELVGIKLFQQYHKDQGENRDIILIPKSAHGTNPATATMAGFETKKTKEGMTGVINIHAYDNGLMNLEDLKDKIETYGKRICGIMITNPNTSGVFEEEFQAAAKMIHDIGGFVYMDGANMNAIAGWVNLDKLGVDAVHNNLHKTWTIPHGGGGPGDAIVAVSEKLIDYLPGKIIKKNNDKYFVETPIKSIGSFHRHWGNVAHKVRCLTYLKRLGGEGIKRMSAVAVLNSQYLYHKLKNTYASLPTDNSRPKMHEFILTLDQPLFESIQKAGIPKAHIIGRIGKLFLDYGLHAPTVAFPEQFGLMVEPTESFSKKELDDFCNTVESIHRLISERPEVLKTVPHFTPIDRVEELAANKTPVLKGNLNTLTEILNNRVEPRVLMSLDSIEVENKIIKESLIQAH